MIKITNKDGFIFSLKFIKVSTNKIYAGTHWTERNQLKDSYLWLLKENEFGKQVSSYPVKLKFVFCFKSKPLDASNCSYMAKMIEDGLVKLGVIKDDSYKHISSVEYISKKGKEDIVYVRIIED